MDEEGCETSTEELLSTPEKTYARVYEGIRFVIDRPFIFYVQEVTSGQIWFIGRVSNFQVGPELQLINTV